MTSLKTCPHCQRKMSLHDWMYDQQGTLENGRYFCNANCRDEWYFWRGVKIIWTILFAILTVAYAVYRNCV